MSTVEEGLGQDIHVPEAQAPVPKACAAIQQRRCTAQVVLASPSPFFRTLDPSATVRDGVASSMAAAGLQVRVYASPSFHLVLGAMNDTIDWRKAQQRHQVRTITACIASCLYCRREPRYTCTKVTLFAPDPPPSPHNQFTAEVRGCTLGSDPVCPLLFMPRGLGRMERAVVMRSKQQNNGFAGQCDADALSMSRPHPMSLPSLVPGGHLSSSTCGLCPGGSFRTLSFFC